MKIQDLFPVRTVGCIWEKGPRNVLGYVCWNIAMVIPVGVDYSQFEVRARLLSLRMRHPLQNFRPLVCRTIQRTDLDAEGGTAAALCADLGVSQPLSQDFLDLLDAVILRTVNSVIQANLRANDYGSASDEE